MKCLVPSQAAALCFFLSAVVMAAEPPPLPAAQAQQDSALVPATDPAVTGAPEVVAALKGKHPRLLFTTEEMTALKQRIASDPVLQKAYHGTIRWSQIVAVPVNPRPPIVADDTPALVKSLGEAPAMAYAYALDHDPAMKQKIIATLTAMMKEPYWADGKELDSSMGAACNDFMAGLLFDAVHDDLDPDLRARLAAGILTHARRMYYLGHRQLLQFSGQGYWQADPQPNHRWYRDMGLAACVLAVADEPNIDDGYMLQSLKDEMDFVMKWYPPDGDCHEGAGYQAFGYLPIALATEMMDRVLGTTYQQTSGLKNACTQQMYYWVPGRKSDISYGDDQNSVAKFFGTYDGAFFLGPHLSRDKDMQAALLHRLDQLNVPDKNGIPPIVPWSLLAFYDPTVTGGDAGALPLARLFPDMGAATMRDSWENNAVVFTFKCGPYGGYKLNEYRETTPEDGKRHYINVAHDDPDANEFAMALNGGFIFHPGVYTISHKVTRQHNTVTVDGRGQAGEGYGFTQPVDDLDLRTLSYLTGWKTGDQGRVIIEGEAGNAYRGIDGPSMKGRPVPGAVLTRFRRTAIWMPGDYVLVLDNIAAPASHSIEWRASAPKSQVTPDGHGTATSETGDTVGYQFVSDQPFTSAVDANFILDGRWGNVPVQQVRFTAVAPAVKFACLLDPWKKSPEMKLGESGGRTTLTIHSASFDDTWTWNDPKDAATPSEIVGTRSGAPLISLTAADQAPTPGWTPPATYASGK